MDFMKKTVLLLMFLAVEALHPECDGQEIDGAAIFRQEFRQIRPVLPRPDTVSMIFLGDIMLHAEQIRKASLTQTRPAERDTCGYGRFDFSQYFLSIGSYISSADLAVANMEFTLGGPPFTGYPAFSAPDSYAEYMAKCGIDVFLTANNHILDRGEQGIRRTLDKYAALEKRFGIKSTGTSMDSLQYHNGNPLVTEMKGIRVALVNFTYGTNRSVESEYPKVNRSRKSHLQFLMQKAKESDPDIIIALPHWGEEYSLKHSGRQYELARWLASNGADIIIGTHPHVVQDSIVIRVQDGASSPKAVPVVFSLGNAISNMSAPNTQIGLMAKVSAVRKMNGKVEILPIEFTYTWCSLPGRLRDTHCTIPVKEYLSRSGLWKMPYEYKKMVQTYDRVKETTGIQDQDNENS